MSKAADNDVTVKTSSKKPVKKTPIKQPVNQTPFA